jgi:hypothetical protein
MVFKQKIKPEGLDIHVGMSVSVRKTMPGQEGMIPLGEGKIRKITNDQISIHIPFLEEKLGDADKIKVFWESGRYYFCGTASSFSPYQKQSDLLTLYHLDTIYYIEKRKHIRLSKTLVIDYKWIAPPETISESRSKRIRTGRAENICCGGLGFLTRDRLGVGDLLELGFEIPSFTSFMIFTQARIVRISQNRDPNLPYKIAVQFTNMDPHDRRLIAEFILAEISKQGTKNTGSY